MQHLALDPNCTHMQLVDFNNFMINKMQVQAQGLQVRETLEQIQACVVPPIFIADPLDGNARRKAVYPGYKSRRHKDGITEAKRTMYESMDRMRSLMALVDCVQIRTPGYEADDVIATLARSEAAAGRRCQVVSTDRDLAQLATNPLIAVSSRYVNIAPQDIRLYKAFVGDTSDSISGVPSFGDKSWISLNKSLAMKQINAGYWETSISPELMNMKPRHWDWCRENFDQLMLMYDIVGLYEVPVSEITENIKVGISNPPALNSILREHFL